MPDLNFLFKTRPQIQISQGSLRPVNASVSSYSQQHVYSADKSDCCGGWQNTQWVAVAGVISCIFSIQYMDHILKPVYNYGIKSDFD